MSKCNEGNTFFTRLAAAGKRPPPVRPAAGSRGEAGARSWGSQSRPRPRKTPALWAPGPGSGSEEGRPEKASRQPRPEEGGAGAHCPGPWAPTLSSVLGRWGGLGSRETQGWGQGLNGATSQGF